MDNTNLQKESLSKKLGLTSKIIAIIYIVYYPLIILNHYWQMIFVSKPSFFNNLALSTINNIFVNILDYIHQILLSVFTFLILLILAIATIKISQNKKDKKRGIFLLVVLIISFILSVFGLYLFIMALAG